MSQDERNDPSGGVPKLYRTRVALTLDEVTEITGFGRSRVKKLLNDDTLRWVQLENQICVRAADVWQLLYSSRPMEGVDRSPKAEAFADRMFRVLRGKRRR